MLIESHKPATHATVEGSRATKESVLTRPQHDASHTHLPRIWRPSKIVSRTPAQEQFVVIAVIVARHRMRLRDSIPRVRTIVNELDKLGCA